jgi:LemA protein
MNSFESLAVGAGSSRQRGGAGRSLLIMVVVLVGIVVVLGGCVMSQYNGIVGSQKNVEGRWAEIDNQYKRRADLVPNLVETVKGAANFEKETLQAVVEARAKATQPQVQIPPGVPTDPKALEAYMKAQEGLGGALSRLLVVAENYPQLKATQNFLSLQDQLEGTENRIGVARRDYIDAAQKYNTRIAQFPGKLVAMFFNFKEAAQFQAAPEERATPKVQFDFGAKDKAEAKK